jgi:hypothetical protein
LASGIHQYFGDAGDERLHIACNGCFTPNYFRISLYLQGDGGQFNEVAYKVHFKQMFNTHVTLHNGKTASIVGEIDTLYNYFVFIHDE